MRRKSKETKMVEAIIRWAFVILFGAIAADVIAQPYQVITQHGQIDVFNSGKNRVVVKMLGKVKVIEVAGLDVAGESPAQKFASLVGMSYDAGGAPNYKSAWKIFINECGCEASGAKFNREYFNIAWEVRRKMLRVIPQEDLDELGQRFIQVAKGGGLVLLSK